MTRENRIKFCKYCVKVLCEKTEYCFFSLYSSEEWQKIGNMERKNLGITVQDDGEFW